MSRFTIKTIESRNTIAVRNTAILRSITKIQKFAENVDRRYIKQTHAKRKQFTVIIRELNARIRAISYGQKSARYGQKRCFKSEPRTSIGLPVITSQKREERIGLFRQTHLYLDRRRR